MRWCLVALLGVIGCLAATHAVAERRVALVIGNAQYAYTAALPNPRNDAQDISELLKKIGFEVTVGLDLDQTSFARTIDTFARALEGADVGLFFYAGHGLQINEKNYLISTGAKLESTFLVPSETIELDAIIRLMESKAGTNLIFLDACRNNPLTDNLKRTLAVVSRSTTIGRGLARVEPTGRDTLVAFSSAPGQESADGRGRNSPFTAALLRHMPKPGLEVSVMLKEVTADVRRETGNAQRPQQLSDMSKTFYFVKAEPAMTAPPPAAAIPPIAPSEPVDPVDVAFWQSAAATNECESIRAYIRRFPTGNFVDLARISERRLCKAGPEIVTASPQPPSSGPVAPMLIPAPATPAAPVPAATTQPAPGTKDALATPAVAAPPVVPAAAPVVPPDPIDIGRKLQKELLRVGCAASGIEIDGNWDAASRDALRSFNERTRSVAVIDRPTPEALEAVRSHRNRVCPTTCEAGTELRGNACVAIPKPQERSRHASRPPEHERDRPLRAQRVEPVPQRSGSQSQSYANVPTLDTRKGESWIYVGKQRCKTFEPPGAPPRIICP
ncbi:MAG TPA: caspase domain-containing protein [Xanthobacteraceae bacterium]|nr:caspase domain-containing protein [Xanthobacteraceae bacterium]